MKLMRALLCAAVLGAFSVPAVASPAKAKKPTPTKVKKAKKAKKAKTKVAAKQRIKEYDFLGDELEGDIKRPDGDDMSVRARAQFGNLIKLRLSFLPEITKAGDNL